MRRKWVEICFSTSFWIIITGLPRINKKQSQSLWWEYPLFIEKNKNIYIIITIIPHFIRSNNRNILNLILIIKLFLLFYSSHSKFTCLIYDLKKIISCLTKVVRRIQNNTNYTNMSYFEENNWCGYTESFLVRTGIQLVELGHLAILLSSIIKETGFCLLAPRKTNRARVICTLLLLLHAVVIFSSFYSWGFIQLEYLKTLRNWRPQSYTAGHQFISKPSFTRTTGSSGT